MVQAPDVIDNMGHPNLPQALVLLSEMNVSAQHVATLVDNMLQRVRNGEISTNQGLSFLEMKYNMLLSYLINLTYVVLRKCSGEKIEGDPCIDRLVEVRTVLEKIRPIDNKLKYQIDKLVKTAVTGTNADDPTSFKAKPDDLMEDLSGSEESDTEAKEAKNSSGIYVPPKLSAMYYTGDETSVDRSKKQQERTKKHALSSAIMEELREEYLETPAEVTHGNRAQQMISKQQQERERYEEEYLTRLPVNKKDKNLQRKLPTLGNFADEITGFGSSVPASKKRKRGAVKYKSKGGKRKRHA